MQNGIDFEAHDVPLKDVMFSNWKFKVPRYQRPYSWSDDHLTDFWLDLTSDDTSYFFGSFILNRESEDSKGYIEIVDGQQRMMTVTIFLAVIRDLLMDTDEEYSLIIQRQDIGHEDRNGRISYRIDCSDTAIEYFSKYIQDYKHNILESKPSSAEEVRIKKNYILFTEMIAKELDKMNGAFEKHEYLKNLRERVSNLIVIMIEIASEEAAYEIFETTNARGVDLSISDLLKNLIFKNIPQTNGNDSAKDMWGEILQYVHETNTEMKRFIRYYWISKYSMVTEKHLFRSIKRKVTNWTELLIDLHRAAQHYNQLAAPTKDDWLSWKHGDRIYKSLEAIQFMNVSQCYVLLLSIMRNAESLKSDPTRIFEAIERFTFLYSAVGKQPANKVEKLYSRFARDIEKIVTTDRKKYIKGNIDRAISNMIGELKDEVPSKEVFREKFAQLKYTNTPKKRMFISYLLSCISNRVCTGEHRIDFDNVNIEHVLPQKPEDWGLTKEDVKDYVNSIGNLTLVSRLFNSAMGNKALHFKLVELAKSEIAITKDLVIRIRQSGDVWNKELIQARIWDLCEVAYNEVWRMD